jgi:ParB family transcriptional regulator, chromosome partitioning protein
MKSLGKNRIKVADIIVERRLRAVDPDWVEAMVVSIRESGAKFPAIDLRILHGGEGQPPAYALIDGGHRLAATISMGEEDIEAEVYDCTVDEARMVEIDRNLVRHDLNPLDFADFMLERKNLRLKMYPQTAQHVAGGKARQGASASDIVSFAADTADRLGWSVKTIERAVSIAANLTNDSKARIRGTELAKCQADLLALAKLGPTEQAAVLDAYFAAADTGANLRAVIATQGDRPVKVPDFLTKMTTAWSHATLKERAGFLEFLVSRNSYFLPAGWRLERVGPASADAEIALPAMIEVRRAEAEAAGYAAYQDGEALDVNPYAGRKGADGRLYFAAWVGGWNAAAEGEAVAPPQAQAIKKPTRQQVEAKAESDGYTAWQHDVRREQNPYVHSDLGLADAWSRGWDQAKLETIGDIQDEEKAA